jgi:hypothetical protein
MFQVEYAVHLQYTARSITFVRKELVGFVPFAGLNILADALGEFRLDHVTWIPISGKFVCRANVRRHDWPLHKSCRAMQKAGWVVDEETKRPKAR